MATIEAWVAPAAKSSLVRQKVELGPLGDEEVEVEVEHCGLCHSDLSVRNNDWGFSQFPAVLGHEAVGRVVEVGLQIASIAYGAMLGVFLLGTVTRRAHQNGAITGMIFGFGVELYLWLATHVAWTWWVPIGTTVTFMVGWLTSLIWRPTNSL